MSAALEARGLTVWQARADMTMLAQAAGTHAKACEIVGLSPSTWHSALGGNYGPGPKVLEAIYGPTGRSIRPELLRGSTSPIQPVAAPEPEETPSIMDDFAACRAETATSVADPAVQTVLDELRQEARDLTVAQLLDAAEQRALDLENALDEALGEIVSLKAMVSWFQSEGH